MSEQAKIGEIISKFNQVNTLPNENTLLSLLLHSPLILENSLQTPQKINFRHLLDFFLSGKSTWNYSLLFGYSNGNDQNGPCGHIFADGEGIYRCLDCGLDDTCVLCAQCFRASEHKGHNTSFHYSKGSGGCCDCGDSEAWKVEQTCTIHCRKQSFVNEPVSPLPKDIIDSIKETIQQIFEFIFQTLSRLPLNQTIDSEILPSLPMDNIPQMVYALVLWNDESHSYQEVIDQLVDCISCSPDFARNAAERVDAIGRDVIQISRDFKPLVSNGRAISRIGLVTTCHPLADIVRQDVAMLCFEWLLTLPGRLGGSKTVDGIRYENLETKIRQVICEILMAPRQNNGNSLAEFFLVSSNKLWKKPRSYPRQLFISTLLIQSDQTKKWLAHRLADNYLEISKQYICDLDGDSYNNSMMALAVQFFTVPTVANSLLAETKIFSNICIILKAIYMQEQHANVDLSTNFAGSIAFAASNQSVKYNEFKGGNGMYSISKHFHFFYDMQHLISAQIAFPGHGDLFNLRKDDKSPMMKTFLDLLVYLQGMHLQTRAINRHVEYEIETWVNPVNISHMLIRSIRLISESYFTVSKREAKAGELLYLISQTHNSLLSWSLLEHWEYVNKFHTADFSTANLTLFHDGFHNVSLIPGEWFRLPNRQVGFHHVSLHHPLQWFLASLYLQIPRISKSATDKATVLSFSELLRKEAIDKFDRTKIPFTSIAELTERLSELDRQLLIFDYPFQATAFIAQIRAGIWVRNGVSIRIQASHFRDSSLRDAYDLNLFLLQTASIKLGGDLFLANLVDRIGLLDWFGGELDSAAPSPFEEDHNISLVQDLLHIIIIILGERSILSAIGISARVKNEMIHQLAASAQGLHYSALNSRLATIIDLSEAEKDESGEKKSFDEILESIANFKYPEGISDQGVYTLKEEYYAQIDPWYCHFTRNQREGVEDILKSKLASLKNKISLSEENLLNLPNLSPIPVSGGFEHIGKLVHAKTFCKVILVALWNTVSPLLRLTPSSILNDAILSEAVHLLILSILIVKNETLEKFDGFSVNVDAVKIMATLDAVSQNISILDLCLALLDRANEEDIKEHGPRLRYAVRSFEEFGDDCVRSKISGWRDKSNWVFFSRTVAKPENGTEENTSPAELKKLASKARQAAILAQFAAAQNSFIANFGDEMEEEEEEDLMDVEPEVESVQKSEDLLTATRHSSFAEGICIVCQEDTKNSSQIYGLLCHIQESNIHREVDVTDQYNLKKYFCSPLTFDEEIVRGPFVPVTNSNLAQLQIERGFTEELRNSKNGTGVYQRSVVPTTCGHLMHASCLQTYMTSIHARHQAQPLRNHPERLTQREYLCPLCKSIGNTLLPIIWNGKTETVNTHAVRREPNVDASPRVHDLQTYLSCGIFSLSKPVDDESSPSRHMPSFPGSFPIGVNSDDLTEARNQISQSMCTLLNEILPSNPFGDPRVNLVISTYDRFLLQNLNAIHHRGDNQVTRDLNNISTVTNVWDLFISFVGSLEIMSRGVPPIQLSPVKDEYVRVGIFDQINSSNLSLLRALSETCISVLLFKLNDFLQPYNTDLLNACLSSDLDPRGVNLLKTDGFSHLSHFCFAIFTRNNLKVDHFFKWCQFFAFFEIVRTLVSISEAILLYGSEWLDTNTESFPTPSNSTVRSVSKLIHLITSRLQTPSILQHLKSKIQIQSIYRIINATLLVYTRRCTLLLYARFGVVPPAGAIGFLGVESLSASPTDKDAPELERLLQYLNLGDIESLIAMGDVQYFQDRVVYWCSNLDSSYWSVLEHGHLSNIPRQQFTVPQALVFELMPLPTCLEDLFEEALRRPCESCATVPNNPAMCLLCGMFVCSQSMCCTDGDKGEANSHMADCGGSVGIYMNIKKCSVLLLSNGNGTFLNPPYLDVHGEVDLGLKRGKRQFLNQKRYSEVRRLWLSHSIPSYVARKIDQSFDNGGWNTL